MTEPHTWLLSRGVVRVVAKALKLHRRNAGHMIGWWSDVVMSNEGVATQNGVGVSEISVGVSEKCQKSKNRES